MCVWFFALKHDWIWIAIFWFHICFAIRLDSAILMSGCEMKIRGCRGQGFRVLLMYVRVCGYLWVYVVVSECTGGGELFLPQKFGYHIDPNELFISYQLPEAQDIYFGGHPLKNVW